MDWRTLLKPNWCAIALFSYCVTYTLSDTSSGSGSMCIIMIILMLSADVHLHFDSGSER